MRRILCLFAILIALASHSAMAQNGKPADKPGLDKWRADIERIETALQQPQQSDAGLRALRTEIDPLLDQVRKAADEAETRLRPLLERQKQLGPKPADAAASEDAALSKERDDLAAQSVALDADSKQLRLLQLRAEQTIEEIADKRRTQFAARLFEKTSSILDLSLWREALSALPSGMASAQSMLSGWTTRLVDTGTIWIVLGITLGMIVLQLLIVLFQNRLLPRQAISAGTLPKKDNKAYLGWLGLRAVLLDAIIPAMILFAAVRLISELQLFTARIGSVAFICVAAVTLFLLLQSVAKAVLERDILHIPKEDFRHACRDQALLALRWCGALLAVIMIMQELNRVTIAPLAVTVVLSGTAGIGLGLGLIFGLLSIGRIQTRASEQGDKPNAAALRPEKFGWRAMRIALWGVGIAAIGAAALGYNALSWFVSIQAMRLIIILGLLALLSQALDYALAELTGRSGFGARKLAQALGVERHSIELLGILFYGMLRVLLVLLAAFLIFSPWGLEQQDALTSLKNAFFSFQLGGINFSVAAILMALLLFTIAIGATRAVKAWLEQRLLPAMQIDAGLKNSIHTTVGYVGFIIAAAIAFSYLGLDVQNIAIVAGALSLGIGFGLQSIVNNFVSGLILLAERPIKTGDLVVTGEFEGTVKRINVRSTEIETGDKAVVIVPNSNLVTGVVKNWMHGNLLGQVKIQLRVAQNSDPEEIRTILLETARAQSAILSDPEPKVYLIEMAEQALVFQLLCTVVHVARAPATKSDLYYDILKRFREEMIVLR